MSFELNLKNHKFNASTAECIKKLKEIKILQLLYEKLIIYIFNLQDLRSLTISPWYLNVLIDGNINNLADNVAKFTISKIS